MWSRTWILEVFGIFGSGNGWPVSTVPGCLAVYQCDITLNQSLQAEGEMDGCIERWMQGTRALAVALKGGDHGSVWYRVTTTKLCWKTKPCIDCSAVGVQDLQLQYDDFQFIYCCIPNGPSKLSKH